MRNLNNYTNLNYSNIKMGCGCSGPTISENFDTPSLTLYPNSIQLDNNPKSNSYSRNTSITDDTDNITTISHNKDIVKDNHQQQLSTKKHESLFSNLPRKIVVTEHLPLKFSRIKREATFYCSFSRSDAEI